MIPKEKATNLYELMFYKLNDSKGIFMDVDLKDECAKQCALIAVDEIIKASPTNPLKSGYIELYSDMVDESTEYWEEVKKEIEAL